MSHVVFNDDINQVDEYNFLSYRSSLRKTSRPLLDRAYDETFSDAGIECAKGDTEINPEACMQNLPRLSWIEMPHVYSAIVPYGSPTCVLTTDAYFVLGTTKGFVLIFNYNEFLQCVLAPSTDKNKSFIALMREPALKLDISYDGTHIAAGYRSGHIFLWDLNSVLSNQPGSSSGSNNSLMPLSAVLEIDDHDGTDIVDLKFFNNRHTGILVSNSSGVVMFHNGVRDKYWQMTYKSEILQDSFINGELLLGSSIMIYEDKHYFGVLSSSFLSIMSLDSPNSSSRLSLSNIMKTKLVLRKKIDTMLLVNSNLYNSAIKWCPYSMQLAYSMNNILVIHKVSCKKKESNTVIWNSDENIIAIYWLDNRLLACLTISHQLLLLSLQSNKIKNLQTLDLLKHDIMVPPNRHLALQHNKILLLTNYTLKLGCFMSWSDTVLHEVRKGDYLTALCYLILFLQADFPMASLLGLKCNNQECFNQLEETYYNLTLAALKYQVRKGILIAETLHCIIKMFISVDHAIAKQSLPSLLPKFMEDIMDIFDAKKVDIYMYTLVDMLRNSEVKAVPPAVSKRIITFFADNNEPDKVQESILLLNVESLDIDTVIRVASKFELQEVLIYTWNISFNDYLTPLVELVMIISEISYNQSKYELLTTHKETDPKLIYEYLAQILNGYQFPKNQLIQNESTVINARNVMLDFIFSGTTISWPQESKTKLRTKQDANDEPAFPYFRLLLDYNTPTFLSILNELFETLLIDQDLNNPSNNTLEYLDISSGVDGLVTRQFVCELLIEIMITTNDDRTKILTALFLASNYPKYRQYIKLPFNAIEDIMTCILRCPDKKMMTMCEDSVYGLLPFYSPSNPATFIRLAEKHGFYQSLLLFFERTANWLDMLKLILNHKLPSITGDKLKSMVKVILLNSNTESNEKLLITAEVKQNFLKILRILGLKEAVQLLHEYDKSLHHEIIKCTSEEEQREYLELLFEKVDKEGFNPYLDLRELYLQLCCKQKNGIDLVSWLRSTTFKKGELFKIEEIIKQKDDLEALSIIYLLMKNYRNALLTVIAYIKSELLTKPSSSTEKLTLLAQKAIVICNADTETRETNWVSLITNLFLLYPNFKLSPKTSESYLFLLQEVFIALGSNSGVSEYSGKSITANILTKVLEHPDVVLMKASDMKDLLLNIFSVYLVDETMTRLFSIIITQSSKDNFKDHTEALIKGWAIENDECSVCGRVLWGINISTKVFQIWASNTRNKEVDPDDFLSHRLVVFECNHGFHEICLKNLGQESSYHCLSCI